MHVRATTISIDPKRVDDLIRFVQREVAPPLQDLPGSLGLSMFADRDSGTCTVSTAWDSEQDRDASDASLAPVRTRVAVEFEAVPTVELFEMAVLDRRRPAEAGFWARMTRVTIDPERIDDAVDAYGTTTLPALELLDGFCSAVLLVDRSAGMGLSSVTFDSRSALDASRELAKGIRSTSVAKMGAEIVEVRESEVVIAGIRAPQSG